MHLFLGRHTGHYMGLEAFFGSFSTATTAQCGGLDKLCRYVELRYYIRAESSQWCLVRSMLGLGLISIKFMNP